MLKFLYTGFYRTYYRVVKSGVLCCIQNDGSHGVDRFVFCVCSKDGEPSAELPMPPDSCFDRKVLPDSLARKEAAAS